MERKDFKEIIILAGILVAGLALLFIFNSKIIKKPTYSIKSTDSVSNPTSTPNNLKENVQQNGNLTPAPYPIEIITNYWKIYENNNIYFKYPQNWNFEAIDIPFNKNDYSFNLIPAKPSINRYVIVNVQILRNNVAKYYFGICCNNKETKVIGHNDFYKIGPTPIDGMVDWLYVSGNQYKLIKFTLGVGNRDDPPPLPTENEAQKELGELKIILSTFRFTD